MKSILCFLFSAFSFSALAVLTGTNALDLQTIISATNSGTAFSVINVAMPPRVFLIQNSGITGQLSSVQGTNSLKVNVQWSADGSNWTTLRSYNPPRTNALVDTYAPDLSQLSVFMRVQAITTNTVTVGVQAIRP